MTATPANPAGRGSRTNHSAHRVVGVGVGCGRLGAAMDGALLDQGPNVTGVAEA